MIHLAADTASTNPLLPSWPEFIIGTILFLIVFGVLAKVLLPRATKMLADRTEQIEGDAARLREEAREQGAQIIAEMREQAQAEARRVTEAAQSQIEAERQQALTS